MYQRTIMTRGFGGKAFDPWARKPRITRMAPRREPNEHDNKDGKKEGPTQADLDAALLLATENETKANTATWIAAENAWKLEQAKEASKTEDERKFDDAVKAAVEAKLGSHTSAELKAANERIAAMQLASVDTTIEAHLATAQIDPKKVEKVIAKLDKKSFLNEDGTVKVEDVKELVAGMSSTANSRPPRTGTIADSTDNGFGKYLRKNQT